MKMLSTQADAPLLVLLPVFVLVLWTAVILAVEILAAQPSYYSGNTAVLPYISDVGRDGVNYLIFSTGGVIGACLIALQAGWLNMRFASALEDDTSMLAELPHA